MAITDDVKRQAMQQFADLNPHLDVKREETPNALQRIVRGGKDFFNPLKWDSRIDNPWTQSDDANFPPGTRGRANWWRAGGGNEPASDLMYRQPAGQSRGGGQSFADVVGGAPQGYAGQDPLEVLAGIDDQFAMKAAGLEETFNRQREELGELFEFAETPEEKARIAFVLGDIEEQRKAGQQVIAREYAEAVQQGRAQAAAMRDAAATEGQAMGDIFRQGADRGREHLASAQQLYADANLGVGAQPVSEDAADFVGVMEAAAPREEALARTLGNIAADDVGFLGETMAAEGGAQQGALMRAALGLRAQAINQHQARLADRQAAERASYRDAMLGMQRDYTGRQWDLQDRGHEGQLRMADILENRRSTAEDRRHQYERDARDFALDQWALEAQEGGADPLPQTEGQWITFLAAPESGAFQEAAKEGRLGPVAKRAHDILYGS